MEIILLVVIVLQFGYLVYSDIQNRAERRLLQVELGMVELPNPEENPDSSPDEEDPYISMDEVDIEQIVKAKDKS